MKQTTHGRIVSIGAACAVVATSVIGATPANAAATEPSDGTAAAARTPSAVLSAVRADLARSGVPSEVAAFDQLSTEQRQELASFFLDPAVASAVTAASDERVLASDTVRTSGDFEWGEANPSEDARNEDEVGTRAASRSSWGTQWFAFAGIRLTETKVAMSYEYSGTTARKLLGYSCTVVRNVQPFTEVKASKSSGYITGGQAAAKCKVVSAKGNGAITSNRWE